MHFRLNPIPRHVAIIMDGNGRWAQARGLPRLAGHRAGTDNVRRAVECLAEYGVEYVTIFAFSTENWSRPASEVRGLLGIFGRVVDREVRDLHQRGVRLWLLGKVNRLSEELQRKVGEAIELTRDNQKITLSVAFDYGGRADIVDAVRRIVVDGVPPEDIDEELVGSYLHTAGLPDPDLIIRTGGEMRLSNFLLWQSAYSEYYATPVFWPDFGPEEIERALIAYSERQRRFGGLKPVMETGSQPQG
ncbi:MAG: polyprenyl diphosphate synthase [Chloroflexota bacterium]|nr:polyprenyl diphosphate synthase [Chloroflexota bacterium]